MTRTMPLSWIALSLLGAALGWIASVVLHSRGGREILGLVLLGTAGAVMGALVITPVLAGRLEPTGFSLPGVLLALSGTFLALGLAALVARLQRRRAG
jgi:uncharacterized membrane protein YeaQ/YmgE (transglycosylase-associated protein family)